MENYEVVEVALPNEILDCEKIDSYTRMTWITLFVWKELKRTEPSLDDLMIRIGCKKARLLKSLQELEDLGYLERERVRGRGNKYTLIPIPELVTSGKLEKAKIYGPDGKERREF